MKIKRFLSVLLAAMFVVGAFALTATAEVKDTTKDVTLTIYALEASDGSEVTVDSNVTGEQVTISGRKPIPGVSFNLYKVDDNETSTDVPEGKTAIPTGYTDSNGKVVVVIPAQSQGRYLVVENEKPDYTKGSTVPFLVDLPMTNAQGTGFLYEVYAYPKQVVEYDTDVPSDSDPTPPQTDTDKPTDTEPTPPDTETDTTTDSEPTPPNTDISTDEEQLPNPEVSKQVSDDNGQTWKDEANIDALGGQKAYWKISAEIPDSIEKFKVYNVGDILDDRLIPPSADEVVASVEGVELPKSSYTVEISGQKITVKFTPSALGSFANKFVDVVFPTAIDLTADYSLGYRIENIATLTFTKIADESVYTDTDITTDTDISTDTDSDGEGTTTTITTTEVEVWTGEIQGYKHDKDNKPLSGAEFTLYSDKECKNQVAKTTSDKNGEFKFTGLLDGTYYLKETKAPEGFQANDNVMEVKLDMKTTKVATRVDVLNVPESNLPVTGGAGIIGISLIGLAIAVLGGFVIYLALRVRKKSMYAMA